MIVHFEIASSKAAKKKEKRKAKRAQRIKENIAMTNCYKCGERGHWARECPYDSEENENENVAMMTLARSKKEEFFGYEIELDSASQVNVVHPRFFTCIKTKRHLLRAWMVGANPRMQTKLGCWRDSSNALPARKRGLVSCLKMMLKQFTK